MQGFAMYLLAGLAAYLLGSLNFGVILSWFLRDDIRRHGSGNAGATNTLRTYGKKAALAVLLGDLLKGTAAVWLGLFLTGHSLGGWSTSLLVVLGHIFPVFFGFRGGKGVATAAGAILILNPWVLFGMLTIFIIVVALTRYVSLASLMAAGAYPILVTIYGIWTKKPSESVILATTMALGTAGLVTWMHRENIFRLLAGTENHLGHKNN